MTEQYTEDFVENICNMVFSDARFTYRDSNVPLAYIEKYTKGMIVLEKGFVDSSCKGGGLSSSFRYLIASSQNKNMPSFIQDYGLCTIASGSYFKVLDVSTIKDKTQITLLHIPEQAVDFFKSYSTNLEEMIIEKAQENFAEKIDLAPVTELTELEWLSRIEHPLGMNDDGELFYTSQ